MAWYDEDENDDDTSFEPEDFDEEITDLDQLWEFAYEDDLYEYEFHGTGDT